MSTFPPARSPRPTGQSFGFLLNGGLDAGGAARRAVIAAEAELPAVRDDVLLLVTELVTNAVRHAGVAPTDRCASSCGTGRGGYGWRSSTRAPVPPRSARVGWRTSRAAGACC